MFRPARFRIRRRKRMGQEPKDEEEAMRRCAQLLVEAMSKR